MVSFNDPLILYFHILFQHFDVDVEAVFGNIEDVADVSQRLLTLLENAVNGKDFEEQLLGKFSNGNRYISDVFCKLFVVCFCHFFSQLFIGTFEPMMDFYTEKITLQCVHLTVTVM